MIVRRTLALVLVLGLGFAWTSAATADDETDRRWSVGARGGYMFIPDFLLDSLWEEHTSISAPFYGVYGAYSFQGFELRFGMNHYHLDFENGEWLKAGMEDDETDYVEADLGLLDVEVGVIWKWQIHQILQWHAGASLGFGFMYGTYESYDVIDGERLDDKVKPNIPPVIPVIGAQTGLTIMAIPDRLAFDVTFGIRNGIFGGGGFQVFF